MDKQECIERQLESALLEGRWGVFERLPSEPGHGARGAAGAGGPGHP